MLKHFLIICLLVFVAIGLQAQVIETPTLIQSGTKAIDTTSVQSLIPIEEEGTLDEEDNNISIDSLLIYTEGEFPAHKLYKIWQTDKVNPYDIRLVDMPDTVAINLAGYCHPICNVVTSNFGFRKWRYHYGIDLRVKRGDSIVSSFDGMVRIARYSKTYGYFVIIRHHNGLETTYAHLSKLLVKPEQIVKAGELIGLGGNTGRSSGPHLHYELRYLGVPINPNDIVDFQTYATYDSTLFLCAQHFSYIKEIEKIRIWTVSKGDTLGRISQKTGVSVSTLCRLNNISTKTLLKIGRKIRYT